MKYKAVFVLLLTALLLGGFVTAGQAGVAPGFSPIEIHRRFGSFIAGSLDVTNLSGCPQSPTAVLQTNSSSAEYFYVFPAVSTFEGVDEASFYILSRTGDYAGEILLSLDVYGLDGAYKRTISNSIDLVSVPTGDWQQVTLSGNNSLSPDELLVAHFVYTAGVGGSMDLRPIFDVKSYSGFRAYLSIIAR